MNALRQKSMAIAFAGVALLASGAAQARDLMIVGFGGPFQDNARVALRGWRFEPLHAGRTGEQWGTITFHFRLRDVG